MLESNSSPNPASSTINVSFSLRSSEYVSLNLYDLQGRLIDVFYEGILQSGYQVLSWNEPVMIENGIYHVVMRTETEIRSEKLVITH